MTNEQWSTRTYRELRSLTPPGLGPSVVAIGTFDGVHLGHQHILQEAVKMASRIGVAPMALTFDRHPLSTLAPTKAPKLLTPISQRIEHLCRTGIDRVVVMKFDDGLAALSAESFLREIVVHGLGARGIVVGYNFRFGHGAVGDTAFLKNESTRHGYELKVVPAVLVGEEHVSSTRIREALLGGAVEEANRLLGYRFALRGPVRPGDARGRTLGFPTANIEVDREALWPMDGVYLTEVRMTDAPDPQFVPALTVISDRPSFDTGQRTIESFLLNFSGEIYGRTLEVVFHRRLREIIRFSDPDSLISQIHRDVEEAKKYFATRSDFAQSNG